MRHLAHSILIASLCAGTAASTETCPPIPSPQDGTLPVWSVWDGTRITRQHVRLDTIRADGQLPVSAEPWAMLLEHGDAPGGVDHVLYVVEPPQWAVPIIGASVGGGPIRADVGCVRWSQPYGWRTTPEIEADLTSMATIAETYCARTIVAGSLHDRSDWQAIAATYAGVAARQAAGETVQPTPSELDSQRWIGTWQIDCQRPNRANLTRLLADLAAAKAASAAAGGALPAIPLGYCTGWTHLPPADDLSVSAVCREQAATP